MKPVERSTLLDYVTYEENREALRARVLAHKAPRRVHVGEWLTFLFETTETARYQVQEMMRIERLVRQHDIEHELETYNELIPKQHGLCASLLIEYETPELRAVWLRKLLGLENHIWFVVGNTAPVKANFDTRQIATDRISSVQYISFQFTAEQAALVAKGAKLMVDHPDYPAEHVLTAEQLEALASDLA